MSRFDNPHPEDWKEFDNEDHDFILIVGMELEKIIFPKTFGIERSAQYFKMLKENEPLVEKEFPDLYELSKEITLAESINEMEHIAKANGITDEEIRSAKTKALAIFVEDNDLRNKGPE